MAAMSQAELVESLSLQFATIQKLEEQLTDIITENEQLVHDKEQLSEAVKALEVLRFGMFSLPIDVAGFRGNEGARGIADRRKQAAHQSESRAGGKG